MSTNLGSPVGFDSSSMVLVSQMFSILKMNKGQSDIKLARKNGKTQGICLQSIIMSI